MRRTRLRKQTLLAVVLLGFGVFMLIASWGEQRDFREMMENGDSATAVITRAYAEIAKAGDAPRYLVNLAWRDPMGQERTFGPTHVSDRFWRQITTNGMLVTNQTEIRYLKSDPTARPVIVADADEREFQDSFGIKGGMGFILVGLMLAGFVVYR